jgi:AraC family transcriptional regulator
MDMYTSPAAELTVGPVQLGRLSHQYVLSSAGRGWSNVRAAKCHLVAQPDLLLIPESWFGMYRIILHLQGAPVDLQWSINGSTGYGRSHAGSVCLVPPNIPRAFSWNGTAHNLHVDLAPELIATTALAMSKTDPVKLELAPQFNFYDPLVLQLCLALLAELEAGGLAGPLYADTLSQALALHFLRSYAMGIALHMPHMHKLSAPQLRGVLDYIDDQIDQNFTLAELAAIAGFSPTYFARQFKQAIGMAPHQYLIHRRVERASLLLARGNTTVAEVAQLVGFADQSHLNRHFKRLIGVAPVALLKDRKNVHGIGWNVQDKGKPAKVS